jgi:hypothetical protein
MATRNGAPMNKLVLLLLTVSAPVAAETWLCTTRDHDTGYEYRFRLEPGVVVTSVQGEQVPRPRPRILTRVLPSQYHLYSHVAEATEAAWNVRVFEQLQWSGTGAVQYARMGTRSGDTVDFVGQGRCERIQ